jgi:hypothetical protein
MTSREKVLNVYPDAHAWSEHPHEWFISSVNEDTDYGGGYTESQAWDDAALCIEERSADASSS